MSNAPFKTVFISSTYHDLAAHRRAVWEVLEHFAVSVRGMEEFGARTEGPLETCLAEVDQSDVYVGIVGFRAGSVHAETSKSFTQLEYERARESGKEVLIYLIDEDNALLSYRDIDVEEADRQRLASFKRTLREYHTVDTFVSAEDLAQKIGRVFQDLLSPRTEEVFRDQEELEDAERKLRRFLLLPKTVSGQEVRLSVRAKNPRPFPVARALCRAFKLPYGDTIGVAVELVKPEFARADFKTLFAATRRVESLLDALGEDPIDIYAKLHFSADDVPRVHAQFFGRWYSPESELEPAVYGEYVSADGMLILEFSRLARS